MPPQLIEKSALMKDMIGRESVNRSGIHYADPKNGEPPVREEGQSILTGGSLFAWCHPSFPCSGTSNVSLRSLFATQKSELTGPSRTMHGPSFLIQPVDSRLMHGN